MDNSISLSDNPEKSLAQNDVRISIEEKDGIQTVSARELHEKLESAERFGRWFDSLLKYGFVENTDFTSVKTSTLVNNGAERELQDYAMTIEMAKQICMLQRSEKGRAYREYFLKLEKAWNTPEAVMSRALQIASRTLEEAKKQLDVQQAQIEEMQPKAVVYDEFVEREKFCNFRDGANYLHISQADFMKLLKGCYIYKNSSGEYRYYGEFSDYFALRPFTLGENTRQQLMLTIKGLEFFRKKMNSAKADA